MTHCIQDSHVVVEGADRCECGLTGNPLAFIPYAPTQREALRGWSASIAAEYDIPNKLGAHAVATRKWGREVADLLWPLDEVISEQRDELSADEDELEAVRVAWEEHGRSPFEKGIAASRGDS